MSSEQANNPLHGLTLAKVIARLEEHYGWDGMAQRVDINCFKSDPSVKSSLKFLRKTQWARDKVEALYISTFTKKSPWDNAK
ncbi:VF530 family protein [Gammaproteobacteria bacterium]|nr:VF530 family protein [Gammaproteobacteria bacterium]